ncbi:MAG: LPS-assembly protein LptD [Nitrospiria bacterium]
MSDPSIRSRHLRSLLLSVLSEKSILFFPLILSFFIMSVFLFCSVPACAQELVKGLSKAPVRLQADHLEFFQDTQTYVATGHVKIIQEKTEISGDTFNFNQETGQMEITGHVLIVEEDNRVRADKINLNVKNQTGIIYQGHMIFGPERYHVDGKEIEKLNPKEYAAKEATVTTCECNQYTDHPPPLPWRIRASELQINPDQYVKGRNVFFEIKDIPVLYSPYLYMPLAKERQSGFLTPQLAYNSQDGVSILQPYYWAIAKDQDLTFAPDFRSIRGSGAELEYRYMTSPTTSGNLFTHYFKDTVLGTDRSEIRYYHTQAFSDHVNARLDLNYVSDQSYYRDLSVSTADISQRSTESNFYLSGRWENQTAYFLTRYTRDLATNSDLTIQKLPEIGYSLHTSPLFSTPLYLEFDSTATYFYQQAGLRVGRGDTYVHLTDDLPIPHLGILTPRAGFRKTFYTRGLTQDSPIERTVTDLGLGLDNSLSRVYQGAEPLTHVIESSLSYEFVPPVDQSDIPQMDNIDLIPDKNLFTYSLTNRLIRKEEIFYLKLTDSYLVNPTEGRFSDLRSEMMFLLWNAKIKTDSFYNFYSGATDIFNTDVWFNSPGQWNFAVGERYTKQGDIPQKGDIFNPLSLGLLQNQPIPIRFVTSTMRVYISSQFTVATKIYYDSQNGLFTESDYGIRYRTKCWGVTVGYIQFPDRNQISFAVDLTGLTGLGGGETDAFKALFGD